MDTDITTESRIKEAARKIFIRKGLDGSRMQEIADEAGINKALLHYYYRSKDKLFLAIFNETLEAFAPKMISILGSDMSLRDKVTKFVDHYLDVLGENPFIPIFIINEMSRRPDELIKRIGIVHSGALARLSRQLEEEAMAGKIIPISPPHFMMNLVSMSIFPFLAKPLLKGIFQMEDPAFKAFIRERKKLIPEFIMRAITLKP